jgi:transcriptional regulator with XRE-family HTH domain
MNQNAISRLESVSYGKPTITTLKRLAAALDVALIVRFVPFSELVDWVSETPRTINGLTTESLAVANFEIEEQSGVFDQPVKTERERRQGTSAIAMDCYSRPTGDEPTEGMTEDMPTFQGSTVNEAQISASLGLDRIFIQQQRHGATTNATAR